MTETATFPSPPASAVWYDLTTVVTAVLAQLRLNDTDVDATLLATLVPAAANLIDAYVDRETPLPGPPPPPVLQHVLEQVTVELYRNKDVPPVSVDGMMAGVWRPGMADPLAMARSALGAYKQRQGLA